MTGMTLAGVADMAHAFDDITDAMTINYGYSIGTNVRYAPFQEFGTSYQSGKPHLRPAFDEVVAMYANQIIQQYDDVEDIVRRIALMIESKTKVRAPVDTGNLMNSYRIERI